MPNYRIKVNKAAMQVLIITFTKIEKKLVSVKRLTGTNPRNVSSEATVRLKIVASAAQQTHHEAAEAVKSFILSLHIMRVQCYSAPESQETRYAQLSV